MLKYRGITLDGYWITGYLTYSKKEKLYYITEDNDNEFSFPVIPESLSVTYTGLTDKNGNQIYASFEVDGKMSKGGDIISYIDEIMNGSQSGVIYEDTSNEGNMFFDAKLLQFNVSNRISIDIESLFEGKEYIEIIGKQWEDK